MTPSTHQISPLNAAVPQRQCDDEAQRQDMALQCCGIAVAAMLLLIALLLAKGPPDYVPAQVVETGYGWQL